MTDHTPAFKLAEDYKTALDNVIEGALQLAASTDTALPLALPHAIHIWQLTIGRRDAEREAMKAIQQAMALAKEQEREKVPAITKEVVDKRNLARRAADEEDEAATKSWVAETVPPEDDDLE